jgi:hypothetical protein
MRELSLVELESELAAALPARNLMSRRRGSRASAKAHANNGSVANGNATNQQINASQSAVLFGSNGGLIGAQQINFVPLVAQVGLNTNSNTNTQIGAPVNFQQN